MAYAPNTATKEELVEQHAEKMRDKRRRRGTPGTRHAPALDVMPNLSRYHPDARTPLVVGDRTLARKAR